MYVSQQVEAKNGRELGKSSTENKKIFLKVPLADSLLSPFKIFSCSLSMNNKTSQLHSPTLLFVVSKELTHVFVTSFCPHNNPVR